MIARRARLEYFRAMSFPRIALISVVGTLLCLSLAGCGESAGRAEEEKEPHFLTGQNLARQMDYTGAVEAYEQALLINPNNASAHFEAALLCESRTGDPAAAIDHYERFLKLAPDSGKADIAHSHINSCKMELAKSVSTLVALPASVQGNLEKLNQENLDLKAQLARLQAANSGQTASTVAYASPPSGAVEAISPAGGGGAPQSSQVVQSRPPGQSPRVSAAQAGDSRMGATRSYTVKAGDTPARIARENVVTVDALLAANPDMKKRSLRIGSVLKLPAP